MPTNPFVTDGTTFIDPAGLAFTLVMGILVVTLPRRYAVFPIIALTCYMTMGMRVIVLGLNFTMLRILLLFGWTRLLIRGELRRIRLNQIDWAMIWFTFASILTYTLLWGTYDAFKDKLGLVYNALGFYFFFRFVLTEMSDIVRTVKIMAVLFAPLAGMMIVEKVTGRNSFAIFGGVDPITTVRDGVLRCQGPFAHPILAGTFGATAAPFFVALWRATKGSKVLSLVGLVSAAVITFTSGSSGPVLAFGCGLVGMAMWTIRRHMRKIRWGLALGLLFLHFVMKAPVWFLLARVDVFSGSTGYHRAYLIDRAIANLSGWWLVGTRSTAAWADVDSGLFDVTNQYLDYGADGGLITLFLFIAIMVCAFRAIGRYVRAQDGRKPAATFCVWALGAVLFSHIMSYLSVSYFDQNVVNWYMLLAMVSTVAGRYLGAHQRAIRKVQKSETAHSETSEIVVSQPDVFVQARMYDRVSRMSGY